MVELIIDQSAVLHLDPLVVLPDLTIAPGERRGVAHLDHGLREV